MEKQENKEYYLYFIETHKKDKQMELKSNNTIQYKYKQTLEKIDFKNLNYSIDHDYVINIYRIRIDPNYFNCFNNKKPIILPIVFKYINKNKDVSTETNQIIENGKNCFLFDFKLKFNMIKKKELNMPLSFMFDIYIKILKDIYKKKITDEECIDLRYYIEKYHIEKYQIKKEYKEYLYYYTDLFLEYYEIKEFSRQFILSFDIKKIDFNNEYINKKKIEIKDKVTSMINDIKKTFKDFNNDHNCIKNIIFLFMIFNKHFYKDIFDKMFDNKDMKNYICEIIFDNPTLFKISLNKEYLDILIKKAKRYEEVIAILSYNNNFLDLLEVINNNKSSLFKLFPKKESLNLKCFFNPKCDYDLNKIYDQIISLLDVNYNFIKFNDLLDNFFEKFKTNFDKIILIHKIIKLIKEKNLSAEKLYSKSINTIKKYYEKEKCQMNNGQLLKYIEIIGVFKNTELSEVIKNFNISSMENNFFLKWKKVNWMKLYENNKIDKSEFYKAVCSIINNMNNFGLLFELFDINTNEKDYSKIMIIYMQNTFQKIIKSKPNCYECPNFVEDVSNLIFYSEIKKCSINIIKKILNNYQDNKIIIEQIYKRLIEKNIEYSEELTKLITEFFINKIQESDSSILFYIIKNTKDHLNDTTISYLKQFSLKEIDFFQIGENESLKLFKKLSNAGMIPDQLPDCDYKNSC